MRVPWTARKFNQQVLQMAGNTRSLMTKIMQRQLRHLGYVLRNRSLVKGCFLGMIEGTRARGRQQMKSMDVVTAIVGCGRIAEIIRMAEDRSRWCYVVVSVNVQYAVGRYINFRISSLTSDCELVSGFPSLIKRSFATKELAFSGSL